MYGSGMNVADRAKNTVVEEDDEYFVVSVSMRNWRPTNEDRRTVLLTPQQDSRAKYFAIFDGHGGADVAHGAHLHLHDHILRSNRNVAGDTRSTLIQGFVNYDSTVRSLHLLSSGFVGSTASVVIIKNGRVYAASVGDSRVIAISQTSVVRLTHDHRPTDPYERPRIEGAGFQIVHGRVNGQLAMSRALGDFFFKSNPHRNADQQAVIARPTVRDFDPKGWKVILLATDGVWEVLPVTIVAHAIRNGLSNFVRPEDILETLVDRCSLPSHAVVGGDNVTAIMVLFKNSLDPEYIKGLSKPRSSTKSTGTQFPS